MLHNEDLLTKDIEEPFLQQLAVVAEPHRNLLSPYICPLELNSENSGEHTVLSHLQTWKRRMHPTYGDFTDLAEIFHQLYIQPPIPAKYEENPPKGISFSLLRASVPLLNIIMCICNAQLTHS